LDAKNITFVKALFCPLQSSAFFRPKQCFPIIVWVGEDMRRCLA